MNPEKAEMNITDFLLARVEEDEAVASNATGARWVVLPGVNASLVNIDATLIRDEKWKYGRFGHVATTSHDAGYAEHIARHDPARVLSECAAKRAIIDWWLNGVIGYVEVDGEPTNPLLPLAAIYKDHPDYQQEWAL